jgi:hypothetical protein
MFHAPECDALTLVRRRRAALERLASGGRTVGGRVSFYGEWPPLRQAHDERPNMDEYAAAQGGW